MTGSALFDFLIATIILIGVVTLFFYAIDFIAKDETLRKIARIAIGIVALVVFLLAIKGVFFGGGGGTGLSPINLIEFAIGLIVILVVVYIINLVIDFFQVPFAGQLKYIVCAIALVVLLGIAGKALFGGGLGWISSNLAITRSR